MDMPIYLPPFNPRTDADHDSLPVMLSALNALLWEFYFGHLHHRHHLPLLTPLAHKEQR